MSSSEQPKPKKQTRRVSLPAAEGTLKRIKSSESSGTAAKKASRSQKGTQNPQKLKIISVQNTVLYPNNLAPLALGQSKDLDRQLKVGQTVGILSQRITDNGEAKTTNDLYTIGTEAKILKLVRFPDNSLGAVVQGLKKFRITHFLSEDLNNLRAEVEYIHQNMETPPTQETKVEVLALARAIKQMIHRAIHLSPVLPGEAALFIENIQDPNYLCDLVIPYTSIEFIDRQALLEMPNDILRLKKVHELLVREIEVLELSNRLNNDMKTEIGKQQRRYLVREQLKILQKELVELEGRTGSQGSAVGNDSGSANPEHNDWHDRIAKIEMPPEAKEAALREADRLGMIPMGSQEHIVSTTYLTWLLDIPWNTYSQNQEIDLTRASEILEQDHYGLKKIKKRILEFLAVCALKKSLKGPIILFVGPPGVGKTSLGKSIARALDRKFIRIALGGVRDEGEIRGHRRTYVASMPGKIVDAIKKAGTMDPVILLDEVDKLANDNRGDPSSALLEVLDPEQNHTFTDHYLSVPLDLSRVFFIATANSLHTIPGPLRDRMEVIELTSYTLEEKNHIAQNHLLPQVLEESGLKERLALTFGDDIMKGLIQSYTREAGVRQLKRELSGIARGIVREVVEGKSPSKNNKIAKNATLPSRKIKQEEVRSFLGPEIFLERQRPATLPVGVATGLAWTPNGGDVLYIESAMSSPGTGKFGLTGQLGDVMKESVRTAFAYIRAHAASCGIDASEVMKNDLHIHFPEGGVKKDGPSAGVAAFLGIVSQLSGRPVRADLAMTGEISLRGDVLPVGGIKEKLLAAHRYGIKQVMIPRENQKDLEDLPEEVLDSMKVIPVSTMDDVLAIAFRP